MKSNGNGLEGFVAIQLSIRYWPGFVKLRAEDIGVDPEKMKEIVYLGNKKLYSAERRHKFESWSNKARYRLHDNSFAFVVDTVRGVPIRNLPRIEAELEEFKKVWDEELVAEFIRDYHLIREEWRLKVEESLPGLWEKLEPHYPSPAVLKRRFEFKWRVFNLKAAEPEETASQEVIEAYDRAKERLQAEYEEMVGDAVIYLRNEVTKTVNNLAGRLKEGKIIKNATLDAVRNIEAWFRDLNIFGDRDVAASLDKLKRALDGVDVETLKSNEDLKAEIAGLSAAVVAEAARLEDVSKVTGRYKRRIDLS